MSMLFSIAGAVAIGCGGLGLDYAHSRMELTAVQANLDAAVLAGVSGTLIPDKQIATAEAYFKRFKDKSGVDFVPEFKLENGVLKGEVDAVVPTTLLRVLNINYVALNAKSSATSEAFLEPLCFMAMHPTRKHTLELKGSVSVIAPDCNVYGNSNHEFDVIDPHTPENFLKAKFVATIGGGHHFLENVSPPPEFGTKVIEDPLSSLSVPSGGDCIQSKYTVSNKSMTLPPGHYCKGLTIKNGSNVTLESGGTYFISGGGFIVDESTVTGTDVTIFLADEDADIDWNKATVRISAKRSGDFAGIAIMGVREETENVFEDSTVDIHGVLYMPKGAFEWNNEGTPSVTAKWSAFIIDGVSWIGSGTITINFRPDQSDVPYPKDLIVMPRPGSARLIY
ncbi:MAG: Tad domain-containing protein [Alphaproteobacteria bacterium]|nr:Tad domain-containing protein [Alphaproteobacteria bacterium]